MQRAQAFDEFYATIHEELGTAAVATFEKYSPEKKHQLQMALVEAGDGPALTDSESSDSDDSKRTNVRRISGKRKKNHVRGFSVKHLVYSAELKRINSSSLDVGLLVVASATVYLINDWKGLHHGQPIERSEVVAVQLKERLWLASMLMWPPAFWQAMAVVFSGPGDLYMSGKAALDRNTTALCWEPYFAMQRAATENVRPRASLTPLAPHVSDSAHLFGVLSPPDNMLY